MALVEKEAENVTVQTAPPTHQSFHQRYSFPEGADRGNIIPRSILSEESHQQ